MTPAVHAPVWDELLGFALSGVEPPAREQIRAALADFGIDTDSSARRVLAALRASKRGTARTPPGSSSIPPPAGSTPMSGGT